MFVLHNSKGGLTSVFLNFKMYFKGFIVSLKNFMTIEGLYSDCDSDMGNSRIMDVVVYQNFV